MFSEAKFEALKQKIEIFEKKVEDQQYMVINCEFLLDGYKPYEAIGYNLLFEQSYLDCFNQCEEEKAKLNAFEQHLKMVKEAFSTINVFKQKIENQRFFGEIAEFLVNANYIEESTNYGIIQIFEENKALVRQLDVALLSFENFFEDETDPEPEAVEFSDADYEEVFAQAQLNTAVFSFENFFE